MYVSPRGTLAEAGVSLSAFCISHAIIEMIRRELLCIAGVSLSAFLLRKREERQIVIANPKSEAIRCTTSHNGLFRQ
jgi:hypothetical protein